MLCKYLNAVSSLCNELKQSEGVVTDKIRFNDCSSLLDTLKSIDNLLNRIRFTKIGEKIPPHFYNDLPSDIDTINLWFGEE